ncbi:unnamed protein product [Orchesella dallaii]|uniref:Uncharacterized protein n=1 Tax=Orchesella dallaii TaxID=48710 RepID=A0ABP1S8B6_9HEXA
MQCLELDWGCGLMIPLLDCYDSVKRNLIQCMDSMWVRFCREVDASSIVTILGDSEEGGSIGTIGSLAEQGALGPFRDGGDGMDGSGWRSPGSMVCHPFFLNDTVLTNGPANYRETVV